MGMPTTIYWIKEPNRSIFRTTKIWKTCTPSVYRPGGGVGRYQKVFRGAYRRTKGQMARAIWIIMEAEMQTLNPHVLIKNDGFWLVLGLGSARHATKSGPGVKSGEFSWIFLKIHWTSLNFIRIVTEIIDFHWFWFGNLYFSLISVNVGPETNNFHQFPLIWVWKPFIFINFHLLWSGSH